MHTYTTSHSRRWPRKGCGLANELSKEKIDLEHRLRQVSYAAAETEATLKSALHTRDAEVSKLTEELAEELRSHLQVQRDMMAEIAQDRQERAALLSRAESSEAQPQSVGTLTGR